jgi:hypothetical protein
MRYYITDDGTFGNADDVKFFDDPNLPEDFGDWSDRERLEYASARFRKDAVDAVEAARRTLEKAALASIEALVKEKFPDAASIRYDVQMDKDGDWSAWLLAVFDKTGKAFGPSPAVFQRGGVDTEDLSQTALWRHGLFDDLFDGLGDDLANDGNLNDLVNTYSTYRDGRIFFS